MAVFNGPLREVLSYILCHDLPDAYSEYAKMHQRYKFSHTELQALQRQRQSLLSSGSCGFIEWCSGRITGSALRKLAALLVEWEEGEPEDNGASGYLAARVLSLFGHLDVEYVTGTAQAFLVLGASSIWRRLHSQSKGWPHRLFAAADPKLSEEAFVHKCERIRDLQPCCADDCSWKMSRACAGDDGEVSTQLVRDMLPTLRCIATQCELGIHARECDHAKVRSTTMSHLGRAKCLATVSADHVLSTSHLEHVRAFGPGLSSAERWRERGSKSLLRCCLRLVSS
jgi:hypothetical protein